MKKKFNGSIEGYIKSLPKAQVLNSPASALMKSAPANLSRNVKTWNSTASKVRIGLRAEAELGLPPISDPSFQSPVAKRLYNALIREWNLIQNEAKAELDKAWSPTMTP